MNLITLFDSIETIASLLAIWCLLLSKRTLFHSTMARNMFVLLLAYNIFHGVGNILEYADISPILDPISDYLKILQPLAWGMMLYAILQQQVKKELQERRKRFQDLVESTSDWVWEADETFAFTYTSPRCYDLIGLQPLEILGKTPFSFMSKEEVHRITALLENIKNSHKPFSCLENILLHKNGQEITLETSGVPFFDDQNKLCGYRGICRDITKRKEEERELAGYRLQLEDIIAERTDELRLKNEHLEQEITRHRETTEAFRQSEKRYQILFEGSQDGLVILEGGCIVDCNQKALDLFGYDRQTFIGKTPICISPQKQANGASSLILCSEHQQKAMAGDSQIFEWQYRRHDNTLFFADVSLHALTIGLKTLLLASVRDITDRKHMEEELFKVQKLESTGILAGGIAHDFNNLLTCIMGNVSLAKHHLTPDSPAYSRLEETEKASQRAKALTQQLLTFSKGGKPITRSINLSGIIGDSATFILSGSNISLDYTPCDDLMSVNADEGQISQVIQNLATNAAQAMTDGGTISIRTNNVDFSKNKAPIPLKAGHYIHIAFKDNGPGMDKALQAKIFDPFFTTKKQGSGLGLAVAYSIIQNHHGLLTVDSTPKKGTTFHIYLPAGSTSSAQADTCSATTKHHGSGCILVMDDEEVVLQVIDGILKHFGYSVDTVYDGKEAIARYKQAQDNNTPYRAVIMDLTIPGGMGGKETIEKLLAVDPDAVAIVASGYANDPIMADYTSYGFKGVITKPFTLPALAELLETVLSQ